MYTATRLLALGLGLGLLAAPSAASTRVGIYAIIDDLTFEPSDLEPDRVLISGVFVVPAPISSGLHLPPSKGHLYFSLNPDAPISTRTDWKALEEAAGTGRVVGFGNYWMPCSNTRLANVPDFPAEANCSLEVSVHADRGTAVSEPYPAPSREGVVTAFDTPGDLCPRFGRSSPEIVAALREAHSPGSVRDAPPACVERLGLVSSSSLDSVFVTQTRDPAWADAMETLVLERLGEAQGLELSSALVECRDTICRVRLVFPSKEYWEATGSRLTADALDELPGVAPGGKIIPPEGQPTLEYYFQRRKPPDATTASAE